MADDSKRDPEGKGNNDKKPERSSKSKRVSQNSEPPNSQHDDGPVDDERASEPSEEREERARALRPKTTRRRQRALTESEINSPKPQTLVLLGAVSVLTLLLWGSAKAACNMRIQVTRPRAVTEEQIVRTPKHAAIELQQRWAKGDFAGAKKLASQSVAAQLDAAKKECDSACLTARKGAAESIFSTAYVIEKQGNVSKVWVRTVGMPGGEEKYVLDIARQKGWIATSRRPAEPDELPTREAPAVPPDTNTSSETDGGVLDAAAADAQPTADASEGETDKPKQKVPEPMAADQKAGITSNAPAAPASPDPAGPKAPEASPPATP